MAAAPAEAPQDGLRWPFAWCLTAVVLGALALRVAYVLYTRGDFMFSDSYGYHFRALLFADGEPYRLPVQQMFGEGAVASNPPDAHIPPMWTTVLGIGSALGFRTILEQQVVTAVVGAVAVGMTGLAGRAVAGPEGRADRRRAPGRVPERLGVRAGAAEQSRSRWPWSPLMLLLVYRFLHRPDLGTAAVAGLSIGLLALTRSEQAMAFVVILTPAALVAAPGLDVRRRIAPVWRRSAGWWASP